MSKCSAHIAVNNPHHFQIPAIDVLERYLLAICQQLGKSAVALDLLIADLQQIQQLNAQYRQQDKPTNVLSFPYEPPPGLPQDYDHDFIGDIAICPTIVEQQAGELSKPSQAHWAHIFIHGILHLYGYDHIDEQDANIMESIEINILRSLGFDNPYE